MFGGIEIRLSYREIDYIDSAGFELGAFLRHGKGLRGRKRLYACGYSVHIGYVFCFRIQNYDLKLKIPNKK